MTECAYCGPSDFPLTREHLISAGILRLGGKRLNFLERAQRIFNNDPVVRDTCEKCNNGPLSKLDGEAISALGPNLDHWCRADAQPITIRISGLLLARWLLKLSYNSARTMPADDLEALRTQRTFILNGSPEPSRFYIFAGLIRSCELSEHDRQITGLAGDWIDPQLMRISKWRDPALLHHVTLARGVFLDAFGFALVKISRGSSIPRVTQLITRKLGFRPIHLMAATHEIPVSNLDVVSANRESFLKNGQVYWDNLTAAQRERIVANLESTTD